MEEWEDGRKEGREEGKKGGEGREEGGREGRSTFMQVGVANTFTQLLPKHSKCYLKYI